MSFVFEQPRASIGDSFAGGEASISDIYAAAQEQMLYVDSSLSSAWALDRAFEERNDEIFKATGVRLRNPTRLSRDDFEWNEERGRRELDVGRVTERRVAEWQRQVDEAARRLPDGNVAARLTRSIEGDALRIAGTAQTRLDHLAASRPGVGKWLGILGGGMTAALQDPVQVATLVFGGGPGAGRTVAGRIISAFAREAFVNGASEAALQPMVQAWRKKAGLDNGLAEAMKNVGFAAAFGGAIGGVGQGAGEIAGRYFGKALDAAGDVAAHDARVAEPLRRAMNGDLAAAAETLPAIRQALPAEARGALDQVEMIGHLDTARPAAALPERHDVLTSEAHRAIELEEPLRFEPDPAQVERVFRDLAGEEIPVASRPVSLVEFLQAKGGVIDDRGELKAIGADALAKNRARRGRSDRRMRLDMAREAAEEAGYLGRADDVQTTTVADLLDAIDREMRGEPVYARADLDQARGLVELQGERAGVENRVHEVAAIAGPAVDDAVIREAAKISLEEGIDAGDALERVYVRAESNEARAAVQSARLGDIMPGWSDEELMAASAARGSEPFDEPFFDDPGRMSEDLQLDAGNVGEIPEGFTMPGPDGQPVTLAKYMEDVANDAELHAVVTACRA